ncbi:MAG: hypothetical protein IE933_14355 [Sphingomonadales bacterium]|nr:hypothetical protein [Sphingomonadales bacterium]MBD3774006.1 hypothetical protein [Paracoccaceae bacterium]
MQFNILHRVIATALLAFAAPLAAEDGGAAPAVPDYSAMSDQELRGLIGKSGQRWIEEACTFGQPAMEELVKRHPAEAALQRGLVFARMFCLDEKGDYRAASEDLATLEGTFHLGPMDSLGLYFAARLDDADAALARLHRMATSEGGKALEELEAHRYWSVARMIRKQHKEAELGKFALEAWDSPGFADMSVELQQTLAFAAIKPAIAAGRQDILPQLLQDIRQPGSYTALLSSREYESIWPAIERHVGAHMANVTTSYRLWAVARLGTNSDDRDRFSDAAHALHFDGKFEDAIALARKWRERPGAFNRIEEGDGWAINIEAYALDSLGRREEADALFDQLAALDADSHPWVVNFVINRADRLVAQGRWQEGLDATVLAREVAEKHGSTYAKMLIADSRVCALYHLSRGDETAEEIAYLLENQVDAPHVAAQALQCAGRDDEAAALLLAAIDDEATRATVLDALQPSDFELFYTASILPKARDLLPAHPQLQAAFDRYARVIPAEFIPNASLRRAQIAKAK